MQQKLTEDELARRDRRIAELEGRSPAPNAGQASDGPDPQAIAQAVDDGIADALTLARQHLPEFKDFTDQELLAIGPQLRRRANLFYRQATADDEARWGVAAGTIVRDDDAFAAELRLLAGPTLQAKRAAAAKAQRDQAVAVAAKRNTAVLTKPKVPPVPRPGGTAPSSGDAPDFEDMESFKQWASR
jgi:hypothetical protein